MQKTTAQDWALSFFLLALVEGWVIWALASKNSQTDRENRRLRDGLEEFQERAANLDETLRRLRSDLQTEALGLNDLNERLLELARRPIPLGTGPLQVETTALRARWDDLQRGVLVDTTNEMQRFRTAASELQERFRRVERAPFGATRMTV